MDKYSYLLISVFLLLFWITIFLFKKELRAKIMRASIVGGFAGLIAEFWYFKDYWRPPLLLGQSVVSFEDFLFGFLITGIAVSIYDTIFTVKNIQQEKDRKLFFGFLFLLGVACLFIFNNWLGFNSILVSSLAFIIFSAVMIFIRNDLWIPSIMSGVLVVVIIIPIYAIIFNVISPDYWNTYWLLADTRFGITVLCNIPATELLWYFSWGCLAGIGYDFVSGNKKVTKFKNKDLKNHIA